MHWFFYPDGKGLFLLPFLQQQGHYTIVDSTLDLAMPDISPVDFRFRLNGNLLILSKPDGSNESSLARY